jgi:cbb3-type cytochrome oxidase maturation protein
MKRLLGSVAVAGVLSLGTPAAAFAPEAPENAQSRWVMVDWMLESFFVFAGFALVAFIWAWKAGHFHDLEQQAAIPLAIEEEDYYTPEWAYDEEEWDE